MGVKPRSGSESERADRGLGSTERKVQAGFAFALACLGVVGVVSYLSVVRMNENAASLEHTHEVLSRLELLLAAATDSETAERGYVITGDEDYLEPYRRSVQVVDLQARRLRELTADNPAQQQRLGSVLQLVTERLANLKAVIELRRNQGFAAAQSEILTGKGKRFHDQIRRLIDQMKDAEAALFAQRERLAQRSAATTQAVLIGGSILACGLVGLALFAIRRDFAGRARAEHALREATDELERFFSLSLDLLCIAGTDKHFKRISPAVTDILGWSTEDFLARPFLHFVHPDDHDRTLREGEKQLVGGEKVLQFENRYRHKDGTWRILSWRSMAQPDGLIYATARDVTELKRTEAALREVNDQLEVRVQQRTAQLEQSARNLEVEVRERRDAQHKLQSQLQRLNLLQQITHAIGERQDIKSIFQAVVRALEDHLPVDFCCICLYDQADSRLIVTSVGLHSEALAMELAMTEQARIQIDDNGLSHCVRGQLVYEPDIRQAPFPFPQRLAHGSLGSMVAAPLLTESKVFGVLIAARQRAHAFSSGECEFLHQLSEHVALAAHQAELYGALQGAYDDLRQTQKAVMQQERLLALGQMASGIAHDINNAISPVALYTESLLEREPDLSPRARSQLETIQRAKPSFSLCASARHTPASTATPACLNRASPCPAGRRSHGGRNRRPEFGDGSTPASVGRNRTATPP